jgi:hypothetical protein
MKTSYIPINVERMALVVIYQGLDKNGEPIFEQVEEPIVAWQADVDGEETIIKPLIAGYQRSNLGTIRIAIYNYDGTFTWDGKQFESLDYFISDFRELALYMEDRTRG